MCKDMIKSIFYDSSNYHLKRKLIVALPILIGGLSGIILMIVAIAIFGSDIKPKTPGIICMCVGQGVIVVGGVITSILKDRVPKVPRVTHSNKTKYDDAIKVAVNNECAKYSKCGLTLYRLSDSPDGVAKIDNTNKQISSINKCARRREIFAKVLKFATIGVAVLLFLAAVLVLSLGKEQIETPIIYPIIGVTLLGAPVVAIFAWFKIESSYNGYSKIANLKNTLFTDYLNEFLDEFKARKDCMHTNVSMCYKEKGISTANDWHIYLDDNNIYFARFIETNLIKDCVEDCIVIKKAKQSYSHYEESGGVTEEYYTSEYTAYETCYSQASTVVDGETYTIDVKHEIPVTKTSTDSYVSDTRTLKIYFKGGFSLQFYRKRIEDGKKLLDNIR